MPILYSDSKRYMDIEYLRKIVLNYSKDIVFLEKLAIHYDVAYKSYNPQLSNIIMLRNYLNDVRFSESKEPFFSQVVLDALNNLVDRAVYKINIETGEKEINYRGLRDLALFVKKYTDKLKKGIEINAEDYEKNR